MSLEKAIKWKYPSAVATCDLGNNIILEWDDTSPKPDESLLLSDYIKNRKPIEQKNTLKSVVKKEAQKRIISIEANWNDVNYVVKQLNALMGAVGFVFSIVSRADANGGLVALTQADRDIAASLQSKESQIKAIRAASNLIEADIDAGKILTEQDVIASKLWP